MHFSHNYECLSKPIQIGQLQLKNRLVMLPMETNYAGPDGSVTERLRRHYIRRASDVGLVLIQISCIESEQGKGYINQLCIDQDNLIPGLKTLADGIHEQGSRVVIQLHHAGANARGEHIVAASAIPLAPGRVVPRALTSDEIEVTVTRYIEAAKRAYQAGFDGVEIVASGNYLIWSFLSPTWNHRDDEYGGDLKGRSRLLVRLIETIKTEIGSDFPVTCRLALKEYQADNGFTIAEASQVIRWAVEAGLDGLTVTAIGGDAIAPDRPGVLMPIAKAIKQAVSIPVTIAAGMDLDAGVASVLGGFSDLVGIGRRLLADPDYIQKSLSGHQDEIRPCIACKHCIDIALLQNRPLACGVNPECGHDSEYPLIPAKPSRRVLVIGGGPAGMMAAITAARRGHAVTLLEKNAELGGQLIPATIPPGKQRLAALTRHLIVLLEQAHVKVLTQTSISSDEIRSFQPDVLIIGTGLEPIIPRIEGIENAHTVTAVAVLRDHAVVGIDVVIVGGDLTGCETAEYLADKGCQVSIVEILDEPMKNRSPVIRLRLLNKLRQKGVEIYTGVKQSVFEEGHLIITNQLVAQKPLPADTVIFAAGGRPNKTLIDALQKTIEEVHMVGDCVEPQDIAAAIRTGFQTGRLV